MPDLSPGQFPDYVPNGLARTDFSNQSRMFLTDRPYGGGSEVSGKTLAGWRGPDGRMQYGGGKLQVVSGYAPNQDDFNDMPEPVKEGPVGKAPKKTATLVELQGKPHSVSPSDEELPINPKINRTIVGYDKD